MTSARLATVAAIAGLAVTLLAGCSSTTSSAHTGNGQSESVPTVVVTTQPEARHVQVVRVVDANTVIVKNFSSGDKAYGKSFTIDENAFAAPTKGACGYDQAVAKAKSIITPKSVWFIDYGTTTNDVYIDAHGVHHGNLGTNTADYGQQMLAAGMGTTDGKTGLEFLAKAQSDARSAKTGLWGTCSDFGA